MILPNASGIEAVGRQTMIKVWWRILPLLIVALFFNYLDKVNIGFAALQMNKSLGLSNTAFGTAAGLFAIGYLLFGIPSTLLLSRFGARRWISLILIAWGLCTAATALVSHPHELFGARLLLGAAEAGFTPGVILYFSYWFPSAYRGRTLSTLLLIQPAGSIIGGPLSAALLSWGGLAGLAGWKWLFIVEGLPCVLLAYLVFRFLTDRPAQARWLAPHEKQWLENRLAAEAKTAAALTPGVTLWKALAKKRLWILAVVYLGLGTSAVGTLIFLPLIIRSMGYSIWGTGFISAVPAVVTAVALPFWGRWTDRSRNRDYVVTTALCTVAAGSFGAAVLLPSSWALVPLSLVLIGFNACLIPFWTLPSEFLTGTRAAVGIAFINVVGNIGNFTGPSLIGWISDATGSYNRALVFMGAIAASTGALMASQARSKQLTEPSVRSRSPSPEP
jgi:MFS transporter, ACS family, tartrate transporter